MEYCENGDLVGFYDKIKNQPSVIKSLYKGVLEGVKFMHDCNLAHLDLKPSNILIGKDNKPKLADFATCCRLNEPQT